MCSTASQDKIDILDKNGLRTGETLSREDIHRLGKIHRAVHLYLFDLKNNLLLQRRSQTVDHGAGVFGISLSGHLDAGESSSEALYREIKEELDLDSSQMQIHFLFSYRQDVTINSSYIDKQFNDVYVCWHSFDVEKIQFDPKEVSELKLVPFSKFEEMVFDTRSDLAPFYSRECREVSHFLNSGKLKGVSDGKA